MKVHGKGNAAGRPSAPGTSTGGGGGGCGAGGGSGGDGGSGGGDSGGNGGTGSTGGAGGVAGAGGIADVAGFAGIGGMAHASALSPQATLNIKDMPLKYSCPLGPPTNFSVNYNDLEGGQPSGGGFSFSNLGADWSMNWVSYLTVTSGVATVRLRTGGIEIDTISGGAFPNNHFTQALLVNTGTNAYTRTLPDGTVETFNLADTATPPHIFMTEVTDPHGVSCLLTYDANFRTTKVTDALGQVSTIAYVSNTVGNVGFYKIAKITEPFGRFCSFGYDTATTTMLISITDQIGLVSKFAYDPSSSMITQMSTPYGTTSFYSYIPYVASGFTATPLGLKTTFPDGTFEVIENWVDENKMTFFWDRHATQIYPNEPFNTGNLLLINYCHCEYTKYCYDATTNLESTAVQSVTHPLETLSPIFYGHPGQTNGIDNAGTSDLPSFVTRTLGNEVVNCTIGGTITAGDTVSVGLVSSSFVSHIVLSSDTPATIATALANSINASSGLQGFGVTAGAAGPIVSMHSDQANQNQYAASVSSGATETVSLRSQVIQTTVGTLTGTMLIMGDQIQFFINFPNGGRATEVHTVVSGDTLTSIVADLVSQANADPSVAFLGFSATASGPVMNLVSYSPILQSYSSGRSGTGDETLTFSNIYNGATQLDTLQYTPFGLVSQSIDSAGRTFSYSYAANNIDLLQKTETRGTDNFQIGAWTYPTPSLHLPVTHTDGSGQVTNYGYNYLGQLVTVTDANSNTTTMSYPATYTATVGGTITNNHIETLTVHNSLLTGGIESVTYTEHTGDTTATIAAGLAAAINADTNLQAINVSATSSASVISLISNSLQATTYTKTVTGMITITISTTSTFGYLTKIDGPLPGNQDVTTLSYDGFGRLYTATDSEGYTRVFSYDALDRPTQTAYPDGSTEQTVWNKLDAVLMKDRIGRWSQRSFDSIDELSYEIDPLGRKTQYVWCTCGSLLTLMDPLGHSTSWQHDLQGRTTQKALQDSSSTNYAYESWSSRLLSSTDARGQIKSYFYNADNTPYQTNYSGAVNATAPVTFIWDQNFNRMASAQKNDWGTISYAYNPYIIPLGTPTTGGGKLATVSNNVIANSSTSYSYDVLGRTTNRSINGSSNSDTWTFDAMSRVTGESNVLGSFAYAYVDDVSGSSKGTTRLASVTYPNSQVTNYGWYPTVNDERLQQIANLKSATGATISQYSHLYDSSGQMTQWQQLQNNSSLNYSLNYDLAGQLTSSQAASGGASPSYLKQNYYAYDLASNRTAVQQNNVNRVKIGGTVTTGNTLTITVSNAGLVGGQDAVKYTVLATDSLSTIASGLAEAITADAKLQAIGVNAATNGSVMSIKSSSPLATTYAQSTSGGATETISLGVTTNFVENAVIGGSKTTGDTVTITVSDPALSGGQTAITYTALSADTLATIATELTAAINGSSSLTTLGVTATSAGTAITIKSASSNATTYSQSTSTGATETVALSINQNGPQTIAIGGAKTTGDIITVAVFDAGLIGGSEAVTYTVLSGDTLTSIAAGVASAINADTNLQGIGVSATSAATVATLQSNSINATSLRQSTSTGATETVVLNIPANGIQTAAIGGNKAAGDVLTLTVYDAGLSGGTQAVSYTVLSSDTLKTIATALATAINGNSNLSGIGVTAAANSTVVNIKSASINATSYAESTNGGAKETITLAPATGVVQNAYNAVNELTNINAGGLATFAGNSYQPLVSASISTSVVSPTVDSNTLSASTNAGATETLSLGQYISGSQTATVGGTATTGDVLTITVENNALTGDSASATYTVPSGSPSTTTMAAGVAAAINADTQLQAIGVTATSAAAVVTIAVSATSYTTTNGTTEILTVYPTANGTIAIAVSGSPTTGDVVKIAVNNTALSTGSTQISYTVLSTDTLQTIASGLVAGINSSSALQTLGVTAQNTAVANLPSTINFTGNSILAAGSNLAAVSATNGDSLTTKNNYQLPVVGTAYSSSKSGGSTETITFGPNSNGNTTVTIGGSKTTGDQLTLTAYNPSLGAGPESLTYTVLSTDTLTTIAAALTSLINSDSKLLSLGVSATSTGAVITIAVSGGAGRVITNDANGNMASDGINSFTWDAENRLTTITYPGTGNNSQFTYDPFSGLVKIVETAAGSITSTKQFVRCGSQMCEERNASSVITKQFFGWGQTLSGADYYYFRNHLGSVTDVFTSTGTVVAHYEYGMFGEVTQTVGTLASDFQYAGYYYHAPSGLNLTTFRAYNPSLGRWINRDPSLDQTFRIRPQSPASDPTPSVEAIPSSALNPLASTVARSPMIGTRIGHFFVGGFPGSNTSRLNRDVNPYLYVGNNPMMWTDPTGLDGWDFGKLAACSAFCTVFHPDDIDERAACVFRCLGGWGKLCP